MVPAAPLLIAFLLPNVLVFSTLDDAFEHVVLVRTFFLVLVLRYICNKHSKDDQIPENQTKKAIIQQTLGQPIELHTF